ncbi:MAG: PPC domain-containing protein [Gemmataceae bacterium]
MIRWHGPCRSPWLGLALLALVGTVATPAAQAGSPRLTRISPPGGQRGTTVEVEFAGRALTDAREVLFYEPGITVEAIKPVETTTAPNGREIAVDPGTLLRVRLKLAANCPLGPHGLRLRTPGGLSEYVRFFVSPYPCVDENETTLKRNDRRESATPATLNTTIFGKMNDPADVDLYRIEVERGQRISAEVEAARLGMDRGIPDMHLTIYDADGKKLAAADDSALFVQDPLLSILAPRTGVYYVEVRHSTYSGSGMVYRLHVGTFVRPTGLYPAGGQAGTPLKVQVHGDPRGALALTVPLPSTVGDFDYAAVDPADSLSAPTPNRLRVSPFPNVLEAEPNDTVDTASETVSLPVAFNGIISKPGDVDCFRFKAKKGEQFTFHALANAIGSPLDPSIWIRSADPKRPALQRATDCRPNQLGLAPANGLNRETHDALLEFTAPADGEYILGVEDERGEGGRDFIYRVEVRPTQTSLHTYIAPEPENQFVPQLRQCINVAAGNRTTVQVGLFSTGRPLAGEMELVGVNLPQGVTVQAPRIKPGTTRVPVVFEAAPGVTAQGALVDLALRPVGASEPVPGGYRQVILMNAYGNNDFYLHIPVTRLALAVTEEAPFRVEIDQARSSLVQNGEMNIKFKVIRRPEFTAPVTVLMEWKPDGVSTATPVTLREGETEGAYLLGASRNATAGTFPVTLTAMSGASRRGYYDGEGRTYVSSALFPLTLAEPHVEARMGRLSIERGKTARLVCKLNHLQPFTGKAQATLARLPRGIELVEPTREITSADQEVTFTLRATPEALVGNYRGIVLDLTVMEKGQPVRQLSGSGMLRVDVERGVGAKPR